MQRIIIALLWTWAIANALWAILDPPAAATAPQFPVEHLPFVVAMPLVVFGVVAFVATSSPFYAPQLAKWVDSRAGPNAFERFLVQLKPLLLFGIPGLIVVLFQVVRLLRDGAEVQAYVLPSFFLSGSVAFCLMHVILRWRGARAV